MGDEMFARRSCASASVDPESALLVSVLRRSLTPAGTDERRLHHKNTRALWLAIKQSECEVTTNVMDKAKATRLTKAHECILQRMTSVISSSDDSDLSDGSHGSSPVDDTPPDAYAYTEWYNCTNDHPTMKR